jgi:SAP domain-containing ribonucleoprotein
MADYATLKVPDLKKLLQERGLTTGGNKADLVARLRENDGSAAVDVAPTAAPPPAPPAAPVAAAAPAPAAAAAAAAPASAAPALAPEDEIDYSDDEVKVKTSRSAPAPAAAEAPAPAQDPAAAAAAPTTTTTEDAAPAAPAKSFALNLPTTQADEEARRRAERAKRFGTDPAVDDDVKRRAERAARFGLADNAVAGLDVALSDGRPPKRGRGQGRDDSDRAAKRQSTDRNGGARRSGRNPAPAQPTPTTRGGKKPAGVLANPEERRKAEERQKRFAASA